MHKSTSSISSPIQSYLDELHREVSSVDGGQVATYIPELAKADPTWFGICFATTDGRIYEAGDSRQAFTIQSISKPFTYGLALEDRGREAVLAKIGVEPTGDAFNSISLEPDTGRPLNPMINAGAIAATSLVAGRSIGDRLERLLAVFSNYAGRQVALDHAVYESESLTGHRNRAIGHMLRNFGILEDDPEPSLDLYFRQCSISVDCRDLSVMAATLANGGINPVTGERAVRRDLVESVLSIMTTCGMYDYAGEWLYAVGMPAKSGVAGGILAVLPGQLGIGVFSPRLDPRGNSVRGVQVCRRLSEDFGLHFLRVARASQSAVRAQYALAEISSKRLRPERERRILDQAGSRARVYDLQGDLTFSAVEAVVRRIIDHADGHDFAVLDLRRVTLIDSPASTMLLELLRTFQRHGKRVVLANAQRHPRFLRFLEEGVIRGDESIQLLNFPDIDPALEWCEDRLLEKDGAPEAVDEPLGLAEHEICGGLSPDELAYLEKVLEYCSFERGDAIIRKGDGADRMFFLAKGQVSVTVDLPSGQLKRLATLSPGMAFGEVALVDDAPRSADVRADGPVECYVLSKKAFDELARQQPVLKMTLLENLLRNVSRMLTRANQEVATLAQ